MIESINIYNSVKLYKVDNGGFAYTDTYGERFVFASAADVWAHLAGDGEYFSDEIRSFIFA